MKQKVILVISIIILMISIMNISERVLAYSVGNGNPEENVIEKSTDFDYMMFVDIGICILFVIIGYGIWNKYGKEDMVVENIQFYPPNNLNSAEIGYIYKGAPDRNDIVSLLIYLANKGYLKIEEYEEENIKKKKIYKIIKLKEYDGENENEKIFFNELFKSREEVKKEDLNNKFYTTIEKIIKNINKKQNQEKIFEKTSLDKRWIIAGMVMIMFIIMAGKNLLNIELMDITGVAMMFLVLELVIVCRRPRMRIIVTTVITYIVVAFLYNLPNILTNGAEIIKFILESVCIAIEIICLGIIKKRTKYGMELLGKIKGFKKFLETAETTKLEAIIKKEPNYFYDILPYAYVLDVSEVWMKKFEDIVLVTPKWYSCYTTFDNSEFYRFMNNTFKSICMSMNSQPQADIYYLM